MSFKFNWPDFSDQFYSEARKLLSDALNTSNLPDSIVDRIHVKELKLGTQPPELEILEVGDLGDDRFRGLFKLSYSGDAHLVLQTKVQVNPMNLRRSEISLQPRFGILAADQPLVVPMQLRISQVRLRGVVVLVVSKQRGVTLVFKSDPLEHILVSSTFDDVPAVRNMLQREIESQLRTVFRKDLPSIIHQLSVQHIRKQRELAEEQELRRAFSPTNRPRARPSHRVQPGHVPLTRPSSLVSEPDGNSSEQPRTHIRPVSGYQLPGYINNALNIHVSSDWSHRPNTSTTDPLLRRVPSDQSCSTLVSPTLPSARVGSEETIPDTLPLLGNNTHPYSVPEDSRSQLSTTRPANIPTRCIQNSGSGIILASSSSKSHPMSSNLDNLSFLHRISNNVTPLATGLQSPTMSRSFVSYQKRPWSIGLGVNSGSDHLLASPTPSVTSLLNLRKPPTARGEVGTSDITSPLMSPKWVSLSSTLGTENGMSQSSRRWPNGMDSNSSQPPPSLAQLVISTSIQPLGFPVQGPQNISSEATASTGEHPSLFATLLSPTLSVSSHFNPPPCISEHLDGTMRDGSHNLFHNAAVLASDLNMQVAPVPDNSTRRTPPDPCTDPLPGTISVNHRMRDSNYQHIDSSVRQGNQVSPSVSRSSTSSSSLVGLPKGADLAYGPEDVFSEPSMSRRSTQLFVTEPVLSRQGSHPPVSAMPSTSNLSRHTRNRSSQSYPVTRSSSPIRRPDRQVPWTSAYYGSYDNEDMMPSWDDLGSPVELLSPEMDKPIVLEPSQSGTAAHLASLANAGYTLSPYTPSFDRVVVHRAKPHGQNGKPPNMGTMNRPPRPPTVRAMTSSTDKTTAKESETGEPSSPFTSPPTTSGSSPSSVLEIRVNKNDRIDEEMDDNSRTAPPLVQPDFKPPLCENSQGFDTPHDNSQLRILTQLDSSGHPMSLPMSSEGFSLNQPSPWVSLGEHHGHPTETSRSTVSLPATPYVVDRGGNDATGSFGQRWYEQHKRRHGYRPVVKRSVYKVQGVSLPL